MATIYLIRHAEATGQSADAPLTPAGRVKAQLLAASLAGVGIRRIMASPFLRAQQTATPLAERLGLPVETDDRLVERRLSENPSPDWMKMLESSFEDPDLRFPGGESSREARSRALAIVAEAIEGGPDTLAIVTHGNLLTLLLSHYDQSLGFACWMHMSNPDVYRVLLERDGTRVERLWVCHKHERAPARTVGLDRASWDIPRTSAAAGSREERN